MGRRLWTSPKKDLVSPDVSKPALTDRRNKRASIVKRKSLENTAMPELSMGANGAMASPTAETMEALDSLGIAPADIQLVTRWAGDSRRRGHGPTPEERAESPTGAAMRRGLCETRSRPGLSQVCMAAVCRARPRGESRITSWCCDGKGPRGVEVSAWSTENGVERVRG